MKKTENTEMWKLSADSTYKLMNIATIILILTAVLAAYSGTTADPDLWGHLRFGLDILESGKIIQIDPYSYLTTGTPWINHEWLAEVSFALAWLVGKAKGLILLKISIELVISILLYSYLLRRSPEPIKAGVLLLTGFYFISSGIANIRPQLYTILFFSLLMYVIIKAEDGQYKWLWFSPFIFIFWVNFHGGFLAGLAILLIWMTVHFFYDPHSWKNILPPISFGILSTVVNPYGLNLLIFLFKTATVPRPEIVEWEPLRILTISGICYLISVVGTSLCFYYTMLRPKPALIVIFYVLAILPLTAMRHISLFGIGIILLASPSALEIWNRFKPAKIHRNIVPSLLITATSVIGTLILFANLIQKTSYIKVAQDEYPITAVSILKHSGISGNMVVDFNYGEYAIWHLGEKIKVSIDGRRETSYSNRVYLDNINFLYGIDQWKTVLDLADLVLIDKRRPSFNLLTLLSNWILVHEDSYSALFMRADFADREKLEKVSKEVLRPGEQSLVFP